MKILTVHNAHYIVGGACRSFIETNRLLMAHGHDVIPFSRASEKNINSKYSSYFLSDIEKNPYLIKSLKRWARTFYSLEAKKAIERLIRDYPPDLAHLHNIKGGISPSILTVLKRRNIPVVQTLHDYKLFCPVHSFYSRGKICEKCKFHRYYNCLLNSCSPYSNSFFKSAVHMSAMYFHEFILNYEKQIDHFITPSNFMKSKAIEYGIDKKKLTYIANFIDLGKYEPCYEFDDYIIYFGRISGEKGVNILIKAMKDIPLDLLILGGGPKYQECIQWARQIGLTNVKFLGLKSGNELKELVQRAMFSVLPSRWYENGPFVIYESFALGTPVLGANIGGIPEFIDEGENGWLFESNDVDALHSKILYAIKSKDRIKLMSRNARKTVEERYSAEGYYKKLMNVYNTILPGLKR